MTAILTEREVIDNSLVDNEAYTAFGQAQIWVCGAGYSIRKVNTNELSRRNTSI